MASSAPDSQMGVLGQFQNDNHANPFGELHSPVQSQHSLHNENVVTEEQIRHFSTPLSINTMQLPKRPYSVPLCQTPPPVMPSQFLPLPPLLGNQLLPTGQTGPNQFSQAPLTMLNQMLLGQPVLHNQPFFHQHCYLTN